jgi:glycosyltransferase involved in cell wall biosynthesis
VKKEKYRKMVDKKIIGVVIAAYNEEELISKVLCAMPDFVDKLIVVDDGSTDATASIAKRYGATVVSNDTNKGVGVALQVGIAKTLDLGVDILVNIDADNQFNPNDIDKLIQPIISGTADFVTASRFKDKALYPQMPWIKFLGNKIIAYIVSKIAGHKFYDASCGFRAYSKDALLKLNLQGGFTYTHESLLALAFLGTRMHEEAVRVKGVREMGKSKIAANIIVYAMRAIKIIFQTYIDYEPFKLFMPIALFFLAASLSTGIFIINYYLKMKAFTPYKWLGFVSGGTLLIFLILLLIGFTLESLAGMRRNQERILYLLKKAVFINAADNR